VGMGFNTETKKWMFFDGFSGVGTKHMVTLRVFGIGYTIV
jgi:hypothetical protein